jgi:hypothetical protein
MTYNKKFSLSSLHAVPPFHLAETPSVRSPSPFPIIKLHYFPHYIHLLGFFLVRVQGSKSSDENQQQLQQWGEAPAEAPTAATSRDLDREPADWDSQARIVLFSGSLG